MKRIFGTFAYGPGPRDGCWWDETVSAPDWPIYGGGLYVDVAIVGAGFTGASAAYHLAKSGVSVAVLDSNLPGWGASGRNGGFCCLGGSMLDGQEMIKTYGLADAALYSQAEVAAIDLVQGLLAAHGIDADVHSDGETQLAHSSKAMAGLRRQADALNKAGESFELIQKTDLADAGLSGPFHGALTRHRGFALNPRKYLLGLADAALKAGAKLFAQTEVRTLDQQGGRYRLETSNGAITAERVIIATNGYSSEDLPHWLAGRYMPAQSNIMVTRPLTPDELNAQGWHSDQMAFDTRNLLHYFRLMPDRRFLFGMRGGLMSSPRAERSARARIRRDFDQMFPAWRDVATTHNWSGMVCLTRNRVPFVGQVPERPGLFAGLAYHGNGVAMGSYAGRLLADLVQGIPPADPYPGLMQRPLVPFPLGRMRRVIMPPIYAALKLADL